MRAYLATNFMGAFAFAPDGKLLECELFPKRPAEIGQKLADIQAGKAVPEEKAVVEKLVARKVIEVIAERSVPLTGISVVVKQDHIGVQMLNGQYRKLAIQLKWASSQADLNAILSQVQVLRTKEQLQVEKRDKILMQAIAAHDELDRSINAIAEHLREWYGLHFPELGRLVNGNEKYAELVASYGNRDNIDEKQYQKEKSHTAGMPFAEGDIKGVQQFARAMLQLAHTRKELASYIETAAKAVVPNMCAIAEPALAARLLLLSGGLEKISRLPSSTIQLLGAEKALFRHLKGEGKAPKYGALFAHPAVQNAPKEKKGKVARLIAAKLAIAARIDFFSKEDRSAQVKTEFEKALSAI